jgi:hypothetical protein
VSTSFYPTEHARLTAAQCEAIGRVAVNWSVVEYVLEVILVKLALGPYFPGLALTNNLGIDNRIGALKDLVAIHRLRYHSLIVPEVLLDKLADVAKQIASLKNRRNRVVHGVWFRENDHKMFGLRFQAKTLAQTYEHLLPRRKLSGMLRT